jgi:hypothetical protein
MLVEFINAELFSGESHTPRAKGPRYLPNALPSHLRISDHLIGERLGNAAPSIESFIFGFFVFRLFTLSFVGFEFLFSRLFSCWLAVFSFGRCGSTRVRILFAITRPVRLRDWITAWGLAVLNGSLLLADLTQTRWRSLQVGIQVSGVFWSGTGAAPLVCHFHTIFVLQLRGLGMLFDRPGIALLHFELPKKSLHQRVKPVENTL